MKTCPICALDFTARKANQIYDSAKCRRKAERMARRAKELSLDEPSAPSLTASVYLLTIHSPSTSELNAICNYYINAEQFSRVVLGAPLDQLPTLILGPLPANWTAPDNIFINTIEPHKHILS